MRLQRVTNLTERMHAALGMVCSTLFCGEDDLEVTLEGVTKLLARAPRQLLDW